MKDRLVPARRCRAQRENIAPDNYYNTQKSAVANRHYRRIHFLHGTHALAFHPDLRQTPARRATEPGNPPEITSS
ncbi:MAG: hypothetical protein WBA73_21095 [Devosia sp.]